MCPTWRKGIQEFSSFDEEEPESSVPLSSSCETEIERYDGLVKTPENSTKFINIDEINIEVRNSNEINQEDRIGIRINSTCSEPFHSILHNPLRNRIIESPDSVDIPITDRVIN